MRMNVMLIFVFVAGICFSSFSQEVESIQLLTESKETEFDEWYTSPSLRWNISALTNIVVPAASLVFEYPFNKRLGLEVESGLILSGPTFSEALLVGEKLNGLRLRISPKIYFMKEGDKDPFYLRATIKYDGGKSLKFREVMDLSQSYREIVAIEETFVSVGGILYGGFMTAIAKNRLVIDLSLGIGYNEWKEQRSIPEDRILIDQPDSITTDLNDAIPVFSLNFQLGYRFQRSKN